MYDQDFEGQVIEFSLITVIIGCNLVSDQWIIFILGQNNFFDNTFETIELTLTLNLK
jgi:hypothetical protein